MPQNDPGIPLNCPACGGRLRYGTSTSSGATLDADELSEVFQTGADVHHYACTNGLCGRFWKFGRDTQLVEDPLRLASGGTWTGH